MSRHDRGSTGRGVSDVIGFTLMFSIIILGIGLVSMTGVDQLTTLSEVEELESGDRQMSAVAATMDDMNRYGDRNRSFTVAFANSRVWLNETSLAIEAETDQLPDEWNDGIPVQALEQRFDREPEPTSALVEGGASFRTDGGFASYEPAMSCHESGQAVVSVVNLTFPDDSLFVSSGFDSSFTLDELSVPGEAPVSSFDNELRFDAAVVDVEEQIVDGSVTLNVSEASQPTQWVNQLATRDDWDDDGSELTCGADETLVRVTTVAVTVETPRFAD